MSELLSQCLPNCSVKPPARRGRGAGKETWRGQMGRRRRSIWHQLQRSAHTLPAAAGWAVAGSPWPRWRRLLPDSIPESKPCSSSHCRWPRTPACCTAVFATHCTAVLRATGRLTPGCGQTRQGGVTTAIRINNGLGDASLPVPHLHGHHTAFKIDPKVLHHKRKRSAALQQNPSTPRVPGGERKKTGAPLRLCLHSPKTNAQDALPFPPVLGSDCREHRH